MSVFRSNNPSNQKAPDGSDRTSRTGDTTFLGDATQALNNLEAPPKANFAPTDLRAAQTGPTPPDKCTNVIAAGAKWNGTLTVDDSVRIDGIFSGEVQSKGTVHVAEGSQVDAKIKAGFVVIAGNFRGDVICEQRTDLLPRSRIEGKITTKVLTVHEGALFDGNVQMSGEGESSRASSNRAARANGTVTAEERAAERASLLASPRGGEE